MRTDLLATLRERTLMADGGMGTMMQRRGLPVGQCGDLWNLENPDAVKAVQGAFVDAGSDLIFTNTFSANRFRLGTEHSDEKLAEINAASVAIARAIIGEGWVVGDLGPTGALIAPLGPAQPEDVQESYYVQAKMLLAAGVDGLIVETQLAAEEITLGLTAARQAIEEAGVDIPLLGSMAFDKMKDNTPRTMWGVDPQTAVKAMVEAGADVLGFNCGHSLEIEDCIAILQVYREGAEGRPLMAKPNAGTPTAEGGEIVYHQTPDEMAEWIPRMVDEGARIVGGCCGTTPDHIAAFRRALDSCDAPA